VLGLDGQGSAESFADYTQWETWQEERNSAAQTRARIASGAATSQDSSTRSKKKLSYLEAREYTSIEQRVAQAEEVLQAKRVQLEDPEIASDGPSLLRAHEEMEAAQHDVDTLYARWAELEKRKG
jgi:ATP-binding cassette subfamily F protein uup